MKIIITGTHFTPAQAVIEEFQKQPNIEIVYIGRKYTREGDSTPSVESQILPKLGVKFIPIISGRLQRSFSIYTIPSLLKIPVGFLQAFYYLIKEKPSVVLAFGGYTSVPVVISAWLLSIPIIIHEQTLVSGLANQINSWFASKIAVSFLRSKTGGKTILTGNPIRKELLTSHSLKDSDPFKTIITQAKKDKLPILLITGGNQGSHVINQTLEKILDDLNKSCVVIHQTGDSKFNDYERLVQIDLKHKDRYLASKWIDSLQMSYLYRNIDLAVSRAGINTLQELAFFGIPTIVIPLPYVLKDEQTINANFFQKAEMAQVLLQSNLTPNALLNKIIQMTKDLSNLKRKAKDAKELVITDAAKKLVLETLLIANQN